MPYVPSGVVWYVIWVVYVALRLSIVSMVNGHLTCSLPLKQCADRWWLLNEQ